MCEKDEDETKKRPVNAHALSLDLALIVACMTCKLTTDGDDTLHFVRLRTYLAPILAAFSHRDRSIHIEIVV